MTIQISFGKDERIIVKFEYTKERVDKIKSIEGRQYNPNECCWTVPCTLTSYKQLVEMFPNDEINYSKEQFQFYLNCCEILKQVEEELKLKGYSFKTRKVYLGHIERFLSFTNKNITEIKHGDIRKYIIYLLDIKRHHILTQTKR